jgi:hypothetical protein
MHPLDIMKRVAINPPRNGRQSLTLFRGPTTDSTFGQQKWSTEYAVSSLPLLLRPLQLLVRINTHDMDY